VAKCQESEKSVIDLAKRLNDQITTLMTTVHQLQAAFSQLSSILANVGNSFDLPYTEQISSSYSRFASFTATFESSLGDFQSVLKSPFFDFFQYQNEESGNFIDHLRFNKSIKEQLTSIESSISPSGPRYAGHLSDIQIFRAYLNHLTHYNFKQFYVHKNKMIAERLLKFVDISSANYANVI
jgi:hypothetical protein